MANIDNGSFRRTQYLGLPHPHLTLNGLRLAITGLVAILFLLLAPVLSSHWLYRSCRTLSLVMLLWSTYMVLDKENLACKLFLRGGAGLVPT